MKNKYSGHCLECNDFVDKNEGHFERKNGRWFVRCIKCTRDFKEGRRN